MVDTCAAEFDAVTPYFILPMTMKMRQNNLLSTAVKIKNSYCIRLRSIRIGQGIEFDYASVHCVWALKQRPRSRNSQQQSRNSLD